MSQLSPPVVLAISLGAMISAVIIGTLMWCAYIGGPLVEARFFPVLIVEHVADSVHTRTDGDLCWSTHFRKLRAGIPAYVFYVLERKLSVTYKTGQTETIDESTPVLAYRFDEGGHRRYLSRRGFTDDVHAPGSRWTEEYCFERPHDLGMNDPFTVVGTAEYEVPHGLWRVPAPMPSFRVSSMAVLPTETNWNAR